MCRACLPVLPGPGPYVTTAHPDFRLDLVQCACDTEQVRTHPGPTGFVDINTYVHVCATIYGGTTCGLTTSFGQTL